MHASHPWKYLIRFNLRAIRNRIILSDIYCLPRRYSSDHVFHYFRFLASGRRLVVRIDDDVRFRRRIVAVRVLIVTVRNRLSVAAREMTSSGVWQRRRVTHLHGIREIRTHTLDALGSVTRCSAAAAMLNRYT